MALMMMIIIVAIIKYRLDEGCRHPPTHLILVAAASVATQIDLSVCMSALEEKMIQSEQNEKTATTLVGT
jgi:hypothetical protein